MISVTHPFASWLLWISASAFLVVFALPLLFAPIAWARMFQWRTVVRNDLTLYFGRCLGALATAIVTICFDVAPAPERSPIWFGFLCLACGLLTFVHVRGAFERSQPWTETAEIALYGGLAVAFGWAYLGLRGEL